MILLVGFIVLVGFAAWRMLGHLLRAIEDADR
jgi:hypothetical protein